jgi:hypothetical protein
VSEVRLSRRLQELSAIVMRELDAIADGDRSSTWTTLEETQTSLSVAVAEAARLERVEAAAVELADEALLVRRLAETEDAGGRRSA